MNDPLKNYVDQHRQEFETRDPGRTLWSRIDGKLDLRENSRISSNWLRKLTYLGFSASMVAVAVLLVYSNTPQPPDHEVVHRKDLHQVISNPEAQPTDLTVPREAVSSSDKTAQRTNGVES